MGVHPPQNGGIGYGQWTTTGNLDRTYVCGSLGPLLVESVLYLVQLTSMGGSTCPLLLLLTGSQKDHRHFKGSPKEAQTI